jgi:putative oxidoreductase
MSRIVYPNFVTGRGALGLFVLRVVTGAAFILHGWPKIQNAFHWMDEFPNPPPGFLQALAALSEFGGGIALILGLFTPLFSLGIACTMAVAITTVHLPHGDPFVGKPGGPSFEPAAVYLAITIMLILVGPGLLSLDALLFGRTASRST